MHKISRPKFFLFTIFITIGGSIGYIGWSLLKEYMGRRQIQNISMPPLPSIPPTPMTIPQPLGKPQGSVDIRSWGERFRDKTIPEVPGIEWQTYVNKEYGFTMEYPTGFWIERGESSNKEIESYIYINSLKHVNPLVYPKGHATLLAISISPKSLPEFIGESTYFDERFKKQGMTPDATMHGMDLFIDYSDSESSRESLRIYFEKYGHSYYFVEVHFNEDDDKKMIEHMIKTFHFLK
ncbi:MAG: hypothetical protein G01um101448_77 [Parcubacteria group bacterium Gr01-1014_48]|nr:MAG: hypothetical protein Greene041614_159 [Parcubacteria group bacterium Greene0416_14]TSC74558.1 MAG: hypothetical protein G01um101448_77 [Parcubacteria group bacterium Gr01-1014_48]TSD01434.1 MAG: hypothetical protein Greene101415_281 [Parcubacteria group bacterium Greene1014_15]TSD08424.1 MAG: hypothetical protein Greene07144_54 [Parcubacteria group bacterium Greene0714_4]